MRTRGPSTTSFGELARLVLPLACAGCGAPDVALCGRCSAVLSSPVRRCEDGAPRLDHLDGRAALPVWTGAHYAGPVRGILPAWKDGGRADLTTVVLATIGRVAREAAPALAAAVDGRRLHVVPVPSRPGVRRRRGADLVGLLAGRTCRELRGSGLDAVPRRALARRPGRDQVGLGARDRGANLARALRVRGEPRGLHLLVDDVLTTGATLAACEEALARAGCLVLGALVVAATPQITRAPLSASGRAG